MSNTYGQPSALASLEAAAKDWVKSRTVWAIAISMLASVLRQHGHIVSSADQQALVTDILGLVQYGGAGLAIAFRVMAKGPLK